MEKSAEPPTAEFRRVCWKARDNFLACAKLYPGQEDKRKNCSKLLESFESSCPKSWVIIIVLLLQFVL